MKKNELRNGDIVITRDGYMGVVIKGESEDYILFKECFDYDFLFNYDEDMIHEDDPEEGTIMKVYRSNSEICGFISYEDGDLVFERDTAWIRPTKEEREAREEAKRIAREKEMAEMKKRREEAQKHLITIMTQAFYGNRTCTQVKPESLDAFIQGYINAEMFDGEDIDRTIVRVPGTDNLVIIYNGIKEVEALQRKEKALKEKGYEMKPLAVIPEENLEIYSRCIVCRMNETGELESLQNGDYEKFIHYLAE